MKRLTLVSLTCCCLTFLALPLNSFAQRRRTLRANHACAPNLAHCPAEGCGGAPYQGAARSACWVLSHGVSWVAGVVCAPRFMVTHYKDDPPGLLCPVRKNTCVGVHADAGFP